MRIFLSLIILLTFFNHSFSQVGINTSTPESSSAFDVYSKSKGVLIPRMYMPYRLGISNPANGLLVYQRNNRSFYYFADTAWKNFNLFANNATALNENKVILGGQLSDDTFINLKHYQLNFNSTKYFGRFRLKRQHENMLSFDNSGSFRFSSNIRYYNIHINGSYNTVGIGSSVYNPSIDNTDIIVDSNGDSHQGSQTLEVNKSSDTFGGTAIGLGSKEFITDGVAEYFLSCTFSPLKTDEFSLGSQTLRWKSFWAQHGDIQTSDKSLKTNITPLNLGLDQIMKLNPISFEWKPNKTHSDNHPRLGFIAQELQEVIPQMVIEPTNENLTLGLNYSMLSPVLTNAIKEQNKTLSQQGLKIEKLEQLLAELKQQNQHLSRRNKSAKLN